MKKQDLKEQIEFLNDWIDFLLNDHMDSCKMYEKKISNLHISLNKQYDKVKRQAEEITLLLKQKEELKEDISLISDALDAQIKFSEILEKQLLQQDKAIERKDEQYEALKKLYKDDLINGMV